MKMNWRLARWWIAANAAGAIFALAVLELNYQSRVRAHDYNPHPIVMAIAIPIGAGAITRMIEMILAIWIFLPTGILFGVLLGMSTTAALPPARGAKR